MEKFTRIAIHTRSEVFTETALLKGIEPMLVDPNYARDCRFYSVCGYKS